MVSPWSHLTLFYLLSISGWGDTGVQETSTDKLQETVVPIVESSNCTERMNQTEGVNEDLIVCAGGAESGGPCKVNHKPKFAIISNDYEKQMKGYLATIKYWIWLG